MKAPSLSRGKICLSILCFREFSNESLQIRIGIHHEGGDGNLQFLELCRQVNTPTDDLPVQTKAVLIILLALFQTSGLAIRDHEYLFVRIFSSS
jgi:hypothetical protein